MIMHNTSEFDTIEIPRTKLQLSFVEALHRLGTVQEARQVPS
jgi:hypothetical protein